MKRIVLFFIFFLLLSASSVWAEEYMVKAGDCLSMIAQKYSGISWQDIQKANPEISNPDRIYVGQKLQIPIENDIFDLNINVVYKLGEAPLNPHLSSWRDWYRYDFTKLENVYSEWFAKGEGARLKKRLLAGEGKLVWVESIKDASGNFLTQYPLMTFSDYRTLKNVAPGWEGIEPAIEIALENDTPFHFLIECGNTSPYYPPVLIKSEKEIEEKSAEVIPEQPVIEKAPKPEAEEACESCQRLKNEFSAGTGMWENNTHDAEGSWWYAEDYITLKQCNGDNLFSILGATPKFGFFARGDKGETDSGYEWDSSGVGPAMSLMWGGRTELNFPQSFEFKIRTLWEDVDGESETYWKKENHFLVGYYAGYDRRLSRNNNLILFSEAWKDTGGDIKSSWWEEEISDRSTFTIGAGFRHRLNAYWKAQINGQYNYAVDNHTKGVASSIELRFNDWFRFGYGINHTLDSDIPHSSDNYSHGPFMGIDIWKPLKDLF